MPAEFLTNIIAKLFTSSNETYNCLSLPWRTIEALGHINDGICPLESADRITNVSSRFKDRRILQYFLQTILISNSACMTYVPVAIFQSFHY